VASRYGRTHETLPSHPTPRARVGSGHTLTCDTRPQARLVSEAGVGEDPDPAGSGIGARPRASRSWMVIAALLARIVMPRSRSRRGAVRKRAEGPPDLEMSSRDSPESKSDWARFRRESWAALIRLILEADPLLCRSGSQMRIVSAIREGAIADRIFRHIHWCFEVLQLAAACQIPGPGYRTDQTGRMPDARGGP